VDIFSGKVRNWQEVGGGDAPIRVLTRELDDSSLMVIRQHISQFATMGFPASSKCVYHDYEMIEALTKYRYSIGWLTGSSRLSIKNSVSVLAVDGVSPTVRNILAGSYKLVEQYALVYKRGALAGTARSFLRFLFSIEGKARMSEFGLIPSDEG
jgi:phosphate transport system substrate-binding protein